MTRVSEFDYDLPEELIAQSPPEERTSSRLLAIDRHSGQISHRRFAELIDYLQPEDVLVLNDTKVIPARLIGAKADTGAKVEVLLLKALENDRWEALVKPGRRVRTGTRLIFGEHPFREPLLAAQVEAEGEMGVRKLRFQYEGVFLELLEKLGDMPLPPYIKRQLDDPGRYQTVYAKTAGSAAAPTAGLHFTQDYLRQIREKGVNIATVTLHVGLGTFRPVKTEEIEEHEMHAEYYEIGREAADAVNAAKAAGGRVVAVGTTVCRTLETAVRRVPGEDRIQPCSGTTRLFIYPGFSFRMVDALLTNFHLPRSTLLMLVSAFAGKENTMRAYREAIEQRYRFFSFGDAMFIY